MKRFVLLALALITVPGLHSVACFNGETITLKSGKILSIDHEGTIIPRGHRFFENDFNDNLNELAGLWKKTRNIDYLSDYALILSLQKRYDLSKKIYLQIEKIKPGRYATASNLGTVYELLGENENALRWIEKAVKINPKSHNGSEWIHVNILKAKLKGDAFISSEQLIHTDFGKAALPVSSLPKRKLLELRNALYFQLNERITFIKPKDKIVSALLFDLANIAWLTDARPHAVIIYEKATLYDGSDHLLKSRASLTKKLVPSAANSLL